MPRRFHVACFLKALCALVALAFLPAHRASAEPPSGIKLHFSIVDPMELRTPAAGKTITLDLAQSVIPERANLLLTISKRSPKIGADTEITDTVLFEQQVRTPRLQDGARLLQFPMSTGTAMPPAGHYKIELRIHPGQHPVIKEALGAGFETLSFERTVFLGVKSASLQAALAETRAIIDTTARLLELYPRIEPASMPDFTAAVAQAGNKAAPDIYDENGKPDPEKIRAYYQAEQEALEEAKANTPPLDEDVKPTDPRYTYNTRQGVRRLRESGKDLYLGSKSSVIPDAVNHLRQMRALMFASLHPMGSVGISNYSRFGASCETLAVRNSILYMHYLLSHEFAGIDELYQAASAGNDAMKAATLQEWQELRAAANALWTGLKTDYLSESFMEANGLRSGLGEMPNDYLQIHLDSVAFRQAVRKDGFIQTVDEYLSTLDELLTQYEAALANPDDEPVRGKLQALQKRREALDKTIRTDLRIHGEEALLQEELEAIEKLKSPGGK